MNAPHAAIVLVLATVLAACRDTPERAQDAPDTTRTAATAAERPEHASLRQIMRWLEQDMLALHSALWRDSLAVVADRAAAVADHPTVPDTVRREILATLGPDGAAFRRADMQVHDAATRLAEAARADDLDAVLASLDTIHRGCVACHRQFRDRLRGLSP